MIKKSILFIVFVLLGNLVFCQDALFTQYQYAPLNLNPGLTGGSRNNLRLTGLSKMQWFNLNKPFRFINVAADVAYYDDDERNIVNLGIMANHSSKGGLNNTNISGLISRNFGTNDLDVSNWYLSIGLQAGFTFGSVNPNDFVFMDQLDPNGITGGASQIDLFKISNSRNYFDMSSGFVFNTKNFMIGGAIHHLNEPTTSFNGKPENSKLPRKLTGHFSYLLESNEILFKPTVIAQFQGQSKVLMIGALVDFIDFPIEFSLFYRNNAGLAYNNAISVGFTWKWNEVSSPDDHRRQYNNKFGLSYDAEINRPGINTTNGSVELGIKKNVIIDKFGRCPPSARCDFRFPWEFL